MSPTKFLIGQIFVVFAVVIATTWAATYLLLLFFWGSAHAWKQVTKDKKREYLNVILDDPHMEEEIRARLVKQGEKHILLWERVSNQAENN